MLDDIARLRKLIQAIPFEPFFEPKWLVELGGPKPVFLDVELGDIKPGVVMCQMDVWQG